MNRGVGQELLALTLGLVLIASFLGFVSYIGYEVFSTQGRCSGIDLDDDGLRADCDPDNDNDGVPNEVDNCPNTPNEDQVPGILKDADGRRIGDACDDIPILAPGPMNFRMGPTNSYWQKEA